MYSGIYEVVVTEALRAQLDSLESRSPKTRPLHNAEAADRIALHLGRQIQHERDGRSIMLFTRLRADDRAFWFLGYRGHVGEKPMAITWELHTPLPGDLYQSFAAAVA